MVRGKGLSNNGRNGRHPGESRDPGCKHAFKESLRPGSRIKSGMTAVPAVLTPSFHLLFKRYVVALV